MALKIAHRAGGYAGWPWIPAICDLRRSDYHIVQLKNPFSGFFEAKNLPSRIFEFGMTQSPFLGQTGGTSRSEKRNGLKPLKPGGVFWVLGTPNYKS